MDGYQGDGPVAGQTVVIFLEQVDIEAFGLEDLLGTGGGLQVNFQLGQGIPHIIKHLWRIV